MSFNLVDYFYFGKKTYIKTNRKTSVDISLEKKLTKPLKRN